MEREHRRVGTRRLNCYKLFVVWSEQPVCKNKRVTKVTKWISWFLIVGLSKWSS